MKTILETERLLLREMTLADAKNLWLLNKEEEVVQYTGDKPFKSVQEAYDFLVNYKDYEIHHTGRWAVIKKADGAFLGWCGIKKDGDIYDLGYRFNRKDWGRGYATESAKACLEYGFNTLGLQEIIGRVDVKNTASIKVLEKIGMHFWKRDSCSWIEDAYFYRSVCED